MHLVVHDHEIPAIHFTVCQHSHFRVAPECTLDDGAGRHIKVGRHVSLRPPPISLVYDTAELIGVDVCA